MATNQTWSSLWHLYSCGYTYLSHLGMRLWMCPSSAKEPQAGWIHWMKRISTGRRIFCMKSIGKTADFSSSNSGNASPWLFGWDFLVISWGSKWRVAHGRSPTRSLEPGEWELTCKLVSSLSFFPGSHQTKDLRLVIWGDQEETRRAKRQYHWMILLVLSPSDFWWRKCREIISNPQVPWEEESHRAPGWHLLGVFGQGVLSKKSWRNTWNGFETQWFNMVFHGLSWFIHRYHRFSPWNWQLFGGTPWILSKSMVWLLHQVMAHVGMVFQISPQWVIECVVVSNWLARVVFPKNASMLPFIYYDIYWDRVEASF